MEAKIILGGGDSGLNTIWNTQNEGKFDVKPNKASCLFVLRDDMIFKGNQCCEEWLFQGKDSYQIVLPTDVKIKMLSDEAVKDKLMQVFSIGKKRSFVQRLINKIIKKQEMYAWTIGNYFSGFYTAKGPYVKNDGKIYNKKSLVIDCVGLPYNLLFKIAGELKDMFKQESVLVKYSFLHKQTNEHRNVAFFVS